MKKHSSTQQFMTATIPSPASKQSKSNKSGKTAPVAVPVRPVGYFSNALTKEEIEEDNRIARLIRESNSH
jgi:hypothetical protein